MPRTKKEDAVVEKKTTKNVDEIKAAIETCNKGDFINLDFSPLTIAFINKVKKDEDSRKNTITEVLTYIKTVEDKCRGLYMNGNQFAMPAINLHISRMNSVLETYEFIYNQSKDKDSQIKVLNNILYVLNDILYPRQYEIRNTYGITYEPFILNEYFARELINKFNYYNNLLGASRF